MGFLQEFKQFAVKGNVLDMAVGVIIGGAFGKIVTSIVNDLLMPIFGVLTGGIDFTNLSVKFGDATISYGNLMKNIVDFLIVAFCIFLIIKGINKFTNKLVKEKEETPAAPPAPSKEEILLTEIRDLLKNK